jgi:hypothetical protein
VRWVSFSIDRFSEKEQKADNYTDLKYIFLIINVPLPDRFFVRRRRVFNKTFALIRFVIRRACRLRPPRYDVKLVKAGL